MKQIRQIQEESSRKTRSDGGFTLMETMLAIAILGFGVLNVSLLFLTANNQNRTSRTFTNMVALVNDYQERLQALQRTTASASFGLFSCQGKDPNGTEDPLAGPGFIVLNNSFNLESQTPVAKPLLTAISPDSGPGGSAGIAINYRLYGYCPEGRTTGTTSDEEPNTYLMLGKAFMVNDIRLPANVEVITAHRFSILFADRGKSL